MMKKIVFLIILGMIVAPSYALSLKYTVGGQLAGITRNYLMKAREASQKNDDSTLRRLKRNFLITILNPDIEVDVLTEDKEKNVVKFKIVDTDVVLWTSIGSLKNEPTAKPKAESSDLSQ